MYRYDLSTKKGCSIQSFSMKETTGQDEDVAAKASKAKGGASTAYEELIRLAIVQVNDKPVEVPFTAFDTWNSRTRGYVHAAFKAINGVDDADMDDFLKTGSPA